MTRREAHRHEPPYTDTRDAFARAFSRSSVHQGQPHLALPYFLPLSINLPILPKSRQEQRAVSELTTTLDDLIANGVALDLFEARQTQLLLDHIGMNAEAINHRGFGRFFGQLQTTLGRIFVLMLCRLLEREVQSYKLRSIPAALNFLDDNREMLQILNRPRVVDFLTSRGGDQLSLDGLSDAALTATLVSKFRAILPITNDPAHHLSEAMNDLKTLRDKSIAHHEVVEPSALPGVKRHDIDALIGGANDFIEVVGPSYLEVHHDLDNDAKKTLRSLEKLLKAAGVYE